MILSILICTLPERKEMFDRLIESIHKQAAPYLHDFQTLVDGRGREVSTGEKRNALLERAAGKYCVFIDDDDAIPEYYIEEIMRAAQYDCDCMAINGVMTTNGHNEKKWFISLGMPYKADWSTGNEIYLRFPNHITPIKTEHAMRFKFPNITLGEDFNWATRIHDSGILKTQAIIHKPMYFYQYIQK